MGVLHDDVVEELVEWFEDVTENGKGSCCVFVDSPSRWGATTTAARFADLIDQPDAVPLVVRLDGATLGTVGPQQQLSAIAAAVSDAADWAEIHSRLGVVTLPEQLVTAISVVDAFGALSGVPAGSLLAFTVSAGIGVFGERAAAAESRLVERARHFGATLARFSKKQFPVVLVVDNGDMVDKTLLRALVDAAADQPAGRLLVVVFARPEYTTDPEFRGPASPEAPVFHRISVGSDMGIDTRIELAAGLLPDWPAIAVHRLAGMTRDFAPVFEIAALPGVADVPSAVDPAAQVEELAEELPDLTRISDAAVIVGWAGGVMHRLQFDTIAHLREGLSIDDRELRVDGQRVGLSDPRRVARAQLAAPRRFRHTDLGRIAEALSAVAPDIPDDDPFQHAWALAPVAATVEALTAPVDTATLRCLVDYAELSAEIDDPTRAGRILAVIGERVRPSAFTGSLAGRVARLRTRLAGRAGAALPVGVAVGLEAKVYETVSLFQIGDTETAIERTSRLGADLERFERTPTTDQWRLTLAYYLVRSGHPTVAAELLQPILVDDSAEPDRQSVRFNAEHVLAAEGPTGDTQIERAALLEHWEHLSRGMLRHGPAEFGDEPETILHDRIARLSHRLGDARAALEHGQMVLVAQLGSGRADHPATLTTRHNIAYWTGETGDPAGALVLHQQLLPDMERVLSPNHPNTLTTRHSIAAWTGGTGDPRAALILSQQLLPDMERVLGADHPNTLTTRHNIAAWTGETGDPRAALVLYQQLLPDRERVLGPDHPDTLTIRNNIAALIGETGDPAGALVLYQQLLPDRERVLGPDHPDTLTIRNNIAALIGETGDPAGALVLYQQLLPDMERVLSPNHPNTLTTRHNIAALIGETGDRESALTLLQQLLPDLKRVLDADHRDTLKVRRAIEEFGSDG